MTLKTHDNSAVTMCYILWFKECIIILQSQFATFFLLSKWKTYSSPTENGEIVFISIIIPLIIIVVIKFWSFCKYELHNCGITMEENLCVFSFIEKLLQKIIYSKKRELYIYIYLILYLYIYIYILI